MIFPSVVIAPVVDKARPVRIYAGGIDRTVIGNDITMEYGIAAETYGTFYLPIYILALCTIHQFYHGT